MIAYFKLLRLPQQIKNLILFFPPFLGGSLFVPGALQKGLLPFAAFCMGSMATYVFNDIKDRKQDRHHPTKRHRPIANGAVSVNHAVIITVALLGSSLALSFQHSVEFWGWLVAYLGLSFAYSTVLKHQPVIDIFCIASGFVFRLFAGGAAFDVKVSNWLFLSVLLLALFLSAGKRLAEKGMLGDGSAAHRKALALYPQGVLEGFMFISGAAVLVTYTMYVIAKHRLIFTVPLCCFGLFRYMLIVMRGESGDPTESLIKDPVMFVVGLVWVLAVAISTYVTF